MSSPRALHPALSVNLCALFAAALTACGGGSTDSGVSASPAAAATTPTDATAAAVKGGHITTTTIAQEGGTFKVNGTQTVRYGVDSRWVQKVVTGTGQCTVAFFGSDPAYGSYKSCQLVATAVTSPAPPAPAPAPAPAPVPAPTPAPAPAPAPTVSAPPPAPSTGTVTAWVRVGIEGDTLAVTGSQVLRYGDGVNWVVKTATSTTTCGVAFFVTDPAWGVSKICEAQVTVPAVVQVPGTMPVVNTALIPGASTPYTTARVRALSPTELTLGVNQPTPSAEGAFREGCNFSHMAFNDPIVYPGQPGVSHLHTFFGNAGTDASSTADSVMNSGGSTCNGGTLNRTAYWMPTLIDIRTGQPLVPIGTNFYYKLGYLGVQAGTVQPFPKGLRMIAGDSKGTAPIPAAALWRIGLECVSGGGHQTSIPSCAVGDQLNVAIVFPSCWDGVNLDSPDHKSHMAYATGTGCPADHPVALPEIALNSHYAITEANSAAFLKLSSDNYSGPGGYSMHADWFNGWDASTNNAFLAGCINANEDCHDQLLGDGRLLY